MSCIFSIIIPFHNEKEKINLLIDSIENLSKESPNFEVIFVNNKSSDGTKDIIVSRKFMVEDALDVASSYYARNIGASCANGEYLVFIDADCILDPFILVEYFKYICSAKNPLNSVFAGLIKPAIDQEGNIYEKYAAKRKILNQQSAITGWAYRPFAQTANAMYSIDAFLKVGGFDASMTTGGDAEICWRFADQLNADFIFAESAVVLHQHRKDISGLMAQFHKYGVGRIQQLRVSERFSKEKKEQFELPIESAKKMMKLIEEAHLADEVIFEIIDFIRNCAYSTGVLNGVLNEIAKTRCEMPFSAMHDILNCD